MNSEPEKTFLLIHCLAQIFWYKNRNVINIPVNLKKNHGDCEISSQTSLNAYIKEAENMEKINTCKLSAAM